MYDIIIIGAGPAGMTAAIYGRRALKNVLVVEAQTYGGQIINTLDIENFPSEMHISGFDFATKLYEQAKELGTNFIFEKCIAIKNKKNCKEVITSKGSYEGKSVILATGLVNRTLGLEKEKEFIGLGVSYCATCDGALYKNRDVAVVGGGNTALEDALYLSNIAKTVYLIHRRDTFRGDSLEVERLKEKENVKIVYNSVVTNILGNDHLERIELTDSEGATDEIEVSGLFIAIGKVPANDIFKDVVELDKDGYITAKEDCHTSEKGVFVAGDNRQKLLRQLVTATSDGAMAATEAIKYLRNLD